MPRIGLMGMVPIKLSAVGRNDMAELTITARVNPMDVSRAARRANFLGSESRATVVRYAMLRAIGYTDSDARITAARKPLNADAGMVVTGEQVSAKIDSDLLAEIESHYPEGITDRSTFIRYSLYRAAEYSHEEALDEATRPHGGGWTKGKPRK
jgi:hypothetical protein